jgi:phosphopantetheinyl transferase
MLAKHREAERAQIANLLWTAKEAAAKVRREGLKLDLRHESVTPQDADRVGGMWQALRIDWADGWSATFGWSCAERGRVMAIVTDRRPDPPEQLD